MTEGLVVVDAFATQQQPACSNSKKNSSSSKNNPTHNNFRLGYVTDVEGNIDYFLKYVKEHSQVLKIDYWDTKRLTLSFVVDDNNDSSSSDDAPSSCSNNNDHYYFVYGGDAVDKGPGDIRLVRALVDLKRRYPDRVYLLVGNRDLNKLRFVAELSDDDMIHRSITEIPPPHWDPMAPSLSEYLETIRKKKKKKNDAAAAATAATSTKEEEEETNTNNNDIQSFNTRTNRLQYMLTHTLGCPQTFEFRREELRILNENTSVIITDEMVVNSFIREIQKGGSLHDYLSLANVAVIIGNTLFCHGAVDRHTMGFVPPLDSKFENPLSKPQGRRYDSAVEWVHALNEYLQKGLDDFNQRPYWNHDRTSRGGEALLALQNRSAMWGRSIVSNCYGDGGCITTKYAAELRMERQIETDDNNDDDDNRIDDPLLFENISSNPMDTVVSEWLLQNHIQRIVVGHKPTGDSPAVLSSDYTGVEIVSADTSFSDTTSKDNRGQATSVVELVGRDTRTNQLHLHGILQTGQTYDSWFPPLPSATTQILRRRRKLRHPVEEEEDDDDDDDVTRRTNNATNDTCTKTTPCTSSWMNAGDVYLGKQLPSLDNDDDWWVKASYYNDTQQEEYYCLARGKGRRVEYQYISKQECMTLFEHDHTTTNKK